LYHGTFAHRYGVDLLVAAVADLRLRIPRVELRLLGDGELRDSLIEQIETLGLGGQVHMSDGFLEAAALPAHIAWADLGLVPNRADVFTNGILPTKLLEYVALGTPVVVARTNTVADYFGDDMVAFYPPGDVGALIETIEDLHGHPAKARALSTAALRFNETHCWEQAARSYLETLERLRT
jgi:glycosyltransferase involved in cell wall biosynthesis